MEASRITTLLGTAWIAAFGTVACRDTLSPPNKAQPFFVADLVARFVSAPDTVAISVDRVVAIVDYTNLGDVLIPPGWETAIVSVSDVGDTAIVHMRAFDVSLAPGETVTRVDTIVPFSVASGVGGILLLADVTNAVSEGNESNNQIEWEVAYTFDGGYGQVWNALSNVVGDTLDLIRFESNPRDAILVIAIPDTVAGGSSAANPSLRLESGTNTGIGGDRDDLNVTAVDDGEEQIGSRAITGGEMLGIIAGATVELNQLVIGSSGAGLGRVQVVIQNCFRMDGTFGATLVDSLVESDCVLWPNPVSGVRTRAIFVSLPATAGDRVNLALESESFNSLLLVFGPDGSLLATDDDGGSGTNSMLDLSISTTGNYMVLISSLELLREGEWSLSISGPDETVANSANRFVPASMGIRSRRSNSGLPMILRTTGSPTGVRTIEEGDATYQGDSILKTRH